MRFAGSYTRALRAFAQCVETTASGMFGYCHGSLASAGMIINEKFTGLAQNIRKLAQRFD
jgi:hypothetical protein